MCSGSNGLHIQFTLGLARFEYTFILPNRYRPDGEVWAMKYAEGFPASGPEISYKRMGLSH